MNGKNPLLRFGDEQHRRGDGQKISFTWHVSFGCRTFMTKVDRGNLRQAIADYMWSEGCGCCGNPDGHKKASARLAKLLKVPKYKDGSGYDFGKYRSKK